MSSREKQDVNKIFEFWCEVTKAEKSQKATGHIIQSFPESFRDEGIINKIPDFVYPCEFENESVQSFSFVLTSDDSKWRFGFCRHDPKTQTAMVIITYLPWHDTFLRLLTVLGELRRINNGEFESFLAETYNRGVPEPNSDLKLFYNCGQSHFVFQRPPQFQLPSIPENHNLNLYYNFVDPKNMISVFAAMLAERRIIFTSRRLDKLSSCVQAANAFLYPMVWQHIFIPVLPMKLKDILSAPMPYFIGVPEAVLQMMTPEELGDVVVLNCDNNHFETPFEDLQQIPSELVNQMKKQLSNSHDHMGDKVSKIFLGILVQLIGGYRDAVRFNGSQKIHWDRNLFIESRPLYLRNFLTQMLDLQIFQQFIDERVEMLNTGLGFSDEFELETLRHAEKMGKRGRHYKEFLKNVKDKTNPAVKSAVKSVKESSRGVKTAYKDLKSKFRDVTPPTSQFHSHVTTTQQNLNPHRSAPNSPVFMKRDNNSDVSAGRKNLATSTSNSYFPKNGKDLKDYPYNSTNRTMNQISSPCQNHLNLSPTISPCSSLSSSDMNLTQELQNHPLFKSPTIERTALLKDVPEAAICIIDIDEESQLQNKIKKNHEDILPYSDSIFDSPPDIQSPPVPPRRSNNTKSISAKKNIETNELSKYSKLENDNNSDHLIFNSIGNNLLLNEEEILKKCEKNTVINGLPIPSKPSRFLQHMPPPPVALPRHKNKEQTKNAETDLILLDESKNTSFDIEDFDPLNMNAKPIPIQSIPLNNTSLASRELLPKTALTFPLIPPIQKDINFNGSTMPSVHNPIYPYFTPQHHRVTPTPTTAASAGTTTDIRRHDSELLKKYGLDQFSLTPPNNSSATANGSSRGGHIQNSKLSNINLNDSKNWTTFD